MKSYDKMYINGEWVTGNSSNVMEDRNPFTGEVIYKYQAADQSDIDRAYAAAKAAQKDWAKTTPAYKQQMMENLYQAILDSKEEIYTVLREEGGSTIPKADFEFNFLLELTRNAVNFPHMMDGKIMQSNIGKDNYVFRRPKGVIGVIAPWNFPVILSMCAVVPAVATGNTVVIKPASDTPATAALDCELFEKAGFPKGVVNYIAGRGSEIGDYFVEHETPAFIYFTGSTEVGERVGALATKGAKGISLEMGGNNVEVILKDADIGKAVNAGIVGAYLHQGEICMSLNRIVCVKERYDEFVEAFTAAVKTLKSGDPGDPDVFVGPIINKSQVDKINDLVQQNIKAGACVAVEGKTEGNVISPWLLVDCKNDMPACKEEIFGPVTNVICAEDEEDAIRITNDTKWGLSNCIITEDLYHGMEVALQIETGMSHINDSPVQDEAHIMFGGAKESGIGRTNAQWVVDEFTEDKWVSIKKD
ncbi:MAG: aldehyde dehydrogenase family protein [Anaerovoracaceae bacterium]|jgi:aldehyde dehydrogenase (NAD+)